jgi:tRNA-dihydrouridine synthase 3
LFKEIKEKQRYDISSHDRLELLKKYTRYGLEHWGSDAQGVERVRYFLLNWCVYFPISGLVVLLICVNHCRLSFLHRYVPVGIVERFPVKLNQRPPLFQGRDDLETLLGSPEIDDWVAITELCGLGPAPDNFKFNPKHKANSYANNEG